MSLLSRETGSSLVLGRREWKYLFVRLRQILSFGRQDARIREWISGGKELNSGKVGMVAVVLWSYGMRDAVV